MLEFLEGIGGASVWPFWAPVLIWTGIAGVAAFVLGRIRGLHPIAGYRLRQALLLALPMSVLAAPWVPGLLPPPHAPTGPMLSETGALGVPSVGADVALGADPGRSAGIILVLLGGAAVAIAILAIGRLAALAIDLRRLRRLRQVATPVDNPHPLRRLRELAEQLGVRRPVELLEGPLESAPMTFGAWRPVIMIPPALLDSPDSLDAVLVHELVHIRRADYSWALLDCLISAAFAFHPLVWALRRGIERCRETSCDAEVLARGFVRPRPYAELLAHTHKPTQFPMPAVAASLSAPSLELKERLETMKNFAHRRLTSRQHVGIVLGAGLVCLVVALAGACVNWTEEENPVHEVISEEDEAQIREYVDAEAGSRGRHYTIPQLSDESISYYYNGTEEDVLQELARLDVQIQYLQEQIAETSATLDRFAERAGDFVVGTEEYLTYVGELARLRERGGLLRSMRTERMRMSEIVKLEYETQKRLGSGPRPRNPATADIF